jgi:hypothetical protein
VLSSFFFSKRIGPNEEKKIVNFKAPDITTPPHWTGMEEELSNRFKVLLFYKDSLSLSHTHTKCQHLKPYHFSIRFGIEQ